MLLEFHLNKKSKNRKGWEFMSLPSALSAVLRSTVKLREQPSWSWGARDEREAGARGRAEAGEGGERASSSDTTGRAVLEGSESGWNHKWVGLEGAGKAGGAQAWDDLLICSGKEYGAINEL